MHSTELTDYHSTAYPGNRKTSNCIKPEKAIQIDVMIIAYYLWYRDVDNLVPVFIPRILFNIYTSHLVIILRKLGMKFHVYADDYQLFMVFQTYWPR